MVTALVHSTQIAEPGDRVEEMKKQNMNLVKKLKKVLHSIFLRIHEQLNKLYIIECNFS